MSEYDPVVLVDSHCHLDFSDFDNERDAVLERALDAGVHRMVSICTKLRNEPQVREIAERYEQVFYAVGTHPMSAHEEPMAEVEELEKIATHPKMVGIGETGLDYHYTAQSAQVQKQSLLVHIEAARRTRLPLIIHSRAADDDMAHILRTEMERGEFTCVMHCFSSSPELAKASLELGFYLSMSGISTFPKSSQVRDIFKSAPLDRILVETDSPYLAPVPQRGKRNEPAYTRHTAQVGADLFEMSLQDFSALTTQNFDRLFWKAR